MRKPFYLGSLESRIYTIFTILIFSTILIMQVVSFRFTLQTVRTSTHDTNRTILNQLIRQIDSYISGMEIISRAVAEDTELLHYLEAPENRTGENHLIIQNRLADYITVREDISDILITGPDSIFISSNQDGMINPWASIQEKPWYTNAVDSNDKTIVSTSYVQNTFEGKYSWVVSLSRGITSMEDSRLLGVLLVDLKFNRISQLCQSLIGGRKGYNFIIDSEGNYIYHPSQQLVYSNIRTEPIDPILNLLEDTEKTTWSEDGRYFMIETSELTGWHVVNVSSESDMISDWRYVQTTFALIGLILFLVVGFATNRISQGITRPVKKLLKVMRTVETGEFERVGKIEASDEIKELAKEYDIMVGRIRELMAANEREHELKRKSDLKALQAQINPHFLYNTLDSIIWMAEMDQSSEVVEMTSALSKLFRISISKGRELIPIRDELAHVQSYLTIQKMRYRDKFKYLLDIDPELYDFTTLKITLQPLVENSIYHGIKEIDHEGFIKISGWEEGDSIILEVADNGRGMDENQLREMIEGIEIPPEERSRFSKQGMGVSNIHARIRIYFGNEYGLTCKSSPENGTIIQVKIPKTPREAAV
ncbi:MAG: sensor histidine kinase [Spirochaetales bacterium]|nr:sensor histidine kinase [Spirochaetales bacterium]